MSALTIDSKEIETLVYKRLDGGERGWRVELLVEQLTSKLEEKFLLCSYCSGLMRDACLLAKGGKQELRCFVCIPEGETWHQAQINRKAINEKMIRCPLRERGCTWIDKVSSGLQHVKECEFLPVLCPLKCVESGGERSGEVARVERRLVAEHEREYCPQRELMCEFCGRGMRACEMNHHLTECPGFPVDCPNGCEAERETAVRQMRRGDVPIHLALCLLQTVKCPYWDYGCEWEMQRGQLDLHEREFMHTHFKLATRDMHLKFQLKQTEIKEIDSQLLQTNEEIRSMEDTSAAKGLMIDLITKDLSELRETVSMFVSSGRLEWKIRGVNEKIERKECTYSDPFSVGLYKCQGKINWNSNDSGKVGCFICVMRGAYDDKLKWPFIYRYKFALLNQNRTGTDYIRTYEVTEEYLSKLPKSFQKPTGERNNGFGLPSFVSQTELLTEEYTKGDSLSLSIIVEKLPSF